jgi:DNA-binding CsgD family transcriptional regulator
VDSRKGFEVARKRYTVEQIITKLREAEVEMAKGATAAEVCRKLGISEQTYSDYPTH